MSLKQILLQKNCVGVGDTMTSTNHDRGKDTLKKFSHLFKKNANNQETYNYDHSPKYRERAQSAPKNEDNEKSLKHRDFALPQTTTGYATHSKAFAFDDDDPNSMISSKNNNTLQSPKSRGHKAQSSINLEQNPLATSQQNNRNNVGSNALSTVSIENLLQDINADKIQINIEDSDDENNANDQQKNDGSYSYSFDAIQDDSYIQNEYFANLRIIK